MARNYGSAVYAVVVCQTVSPSVTSRHCIKKAKRRITQTTPYDRSGSIVFWCQKSRRNSDGSPKTEGPDRGGVR